MAISAAALDDLTAKGADRGVDLRPGLLAVEAQMRETVHATNPFVEDAARYLIDAGGKRFRPMLVLLSGMLGGAQATHPDLISGGVIVELVHLSTLYHDDVIDAALPDPAPPRGPYRAEGSSDRAFHRAVAMAKHDHSPLLSAHVLLAVIESRHGTVARALALAGGRRRQGRSSAGGLPAAGRRHRLAEPHPTRWHACAE